MCNQRRFIVKYHYDIRKGVKKLKTKTNSVIAAGVAASILAFVPTLGVLAASNVSVNFETPVYHTGSINGQDGWTSTGSVGSGCATYDHAVSSSLGTQGFGTQSLRVSDAVTSGCFGDQTFAKPLTDAVGETGATAGSYTVGNRQNHFETQFNFASTTPNAQQPGMHVSVSPDRGDGSRMSYLRFEDNSGGIDVFFVDVIGTGNPSNFHETKIATLDRSKVHKVKLTLDTVDGPSNDVVRVWIDGDQKITGTSWENYYRYDNESAAEQSPRIVKTVLFRTSGDAHPADSGKGFLFDNVSLKSNNDQDLGKVKGEMKMSDPSQKIVINVSDKKDDNSKKDKDEDKKDNKNNTVEYWNYDYPGVLHYKADVLCTNINSDTNEARVMFQIPGGYPGLSGLYVVAYVKENNQKYAKDLYGHNATTDLDTATQWCQGGSDAGFAPAMYQVTKGDIEVK